MFGIMLDLPEVELNLNSDSVIFSPGSSLQQAWVSRVHDFHIYRGRIQSKLPAQVFTDAGNLVCRGHITPRYTAGPDPYWVVLDTMGRRAYCIKSSDNLCLLKQWENTQICCSLFCYVTVPWVLRAAACVSVRKVVCPEPQDSGLM